MTNNTWMTIEAQIKQEWNWFYASVALHPHLWLVAALFVSSLTTHFIDKVL